MAFQYLPHVEHTPDYHTLFLNGFNEIVGPGATVRTATPVPLTAIL